MKKYSLRKAIKYLNLQLPDTDMPEFYIRHPFILIS